MDPPGTVPLFVSLTADMTAKTRNRSALQALAVAAGVITAFAVFGQNILTYTHMSLAALQGAGGLLLILIALQLLTGVGDGPESAARYKHVAFVPLGTPLMAGPGAIVAVMVFTQQANRPPRITTVVAGVLLTFCDAVLGYALCIFCPEGPGRGRCRAGDSHCRPLVIRHRCPNDC